MLGICFSCADGAYCFFSARWFGCLRILFSQSPPSVISLEATH